MPQHSIDLCNKGISLNKSCKYRQGSLICLPEAGRVIVSGDLHGNRRNFDRIVTYADLENNPDTHVILQEIVHGGPEDNLGGCLSYQLLLQALEYKLEYPEQVHILLGNHDTAVITNSSVLKAGKEMNEAMRSAMKRQFEEHFGNVQDSLVEYLMSQPLAVRTANGIWISHSLPADRYVDSFDPEIFSRDFTLEDIQRPNPVYNFTWGRRHSQDALNKMAQMLNVDVFILGHQPQESGWSIAGENAIILASEHAHGCILEFDLAKKYTAEELSLGIKLLAAIE